MKRTDPQFKLRLDADLKKWLEEQAQRNLRSVTNEIVYRLQRSRQGDTGEPGGGEPNGTIVALATAGHSRISCDSSD